MASSREEERKGKGRASCSLIIEPLGLNIWRTRCKHIIRCSVLPCCRVGSPWSPRDSQESSPTPQFKSTTVQLSHPYMTTGKTIALTRRTFVGKVMSLLLNMLSRFIITFLPRSKHLLIFHGCSHHLQ